ncbi:heterokaryon incompatibility protein-domain-containing protein [Alternaria rosae]|uniref:heterokaryon incompatibility protein-domain-containing protein n=1 Tax=Alternaria rosae TaxID=1187941 RepID=UPI001E8E15E1|nr:heterokaryon incompatibility protein-domain-containing protein [Alternaria rosae]KAH6857412.1 heterokaryon incompatibility protein-domain-containing protein [Alternaria rosae]
MESVYRLLVGDQIRFVKIQPGAWTDPVRCDLVYLPLPNAETDVVEAWFSGRPLPKLLHQELHDPRPSSMSSLTGYASEAPAAIAPTAGIPPFVALSYAWGHPGQTEELLLDGHPVQKTVNLVAGLRQLRGMLGDPSRAPSIFGSPDVLFWIDALCINQEDNAEKSTQVPRIGAIYGAADVVVAWLGENGEDDGTIHEFMTLANNMEFENQSEFFESAYPRFDTLDSAKLSDVLYAYKSLMGRSWFERICVIQEMALSRCTVILAGSYSCQYKPFTAALRGSVSQFKATVPHDYIYGILSMGGNMVNCRKLSPDYTLRFEDVYHECTTLILEHTGDLNIIPRYRNRLDGMPSWVPDYRCNIVSPALTEWLPGEASGTSDVSVSDDGRVLSTRGARLGHVKLALNHSCFIGYSVKGAVIINRFDEFLERSCKEERLDKHDVLTGVLEVFCQDLSLRRFQANQVRGVYDDIVSDSPSTGGQGDSSCRDITIGLLSKIANGSFFVTSQGLILGLARHDEEAREGDVVVMMKGAERPWLLRHVVGDDQEDFTFVGACEPLYTHIGGLKDWRSMNEALFKQTRVQFFARNEIREFRLV